MKRGKSEALTLFRREILEKLERNHFSGRLKVVWENGKVVLFRLTTNFGFNLRKEDEFEFFPEF